VGNPIYEITNAQKDVFKVFEDRITIFRKSAFSPDGRGERSIPISSLTSVQYKPRGTLTAAYIQLGVFGKEAVGGTMKAAQDENSFFFPRNTSNEQVLEIKEFIEKAMLNKQSSTVIQHASAADELLKFKASVRRRRYHASGV